MSDETIHGYNYKVRIWYPDAPENSTEGTILAAYDEDLAKQIQLQYPGVTYEVISKEPVLGDPQLERIPAKATGWDHGPECECHVCRIRRQPQGNPGEKPSRLELIRRIKPILPSAQLNMSGDLLRGEEGEHFEKVFLRLAQTFEAMPQPYQTEGTPTNDKIIHLHYFTSGSDWYIIERDTGQEQIQAFGYVILNQDLQNAEWGYVNIEEMKGYPQVELDFHWTPKTFKEVMIVKNPDAINSDNPGNPEPDNELLFKAPLARAEQFMNELRRMGFDVGHDADYEDPENYMTVIVRDVPPERTKLLLDTAKRYTIFPKQGNPGAADNLRDRLIAEIYDNRLNAWKQGHVGVRPVSDDDLTELRGMATQELEQTAKLTRQFLIPMVGQTQEDPKPKKEIEKIAQEHWDKLEINIRRDYLMDYVERQIPGAQDYYLQSWRGLSQEIRNFILTAYKK